MKKLTLTILLICSSLIYADEEIKTICSPTQCYQIEKELGNGAFGKVFAVRGGDEQLFALKSYFPNTHDWAIATILANGKREFELGQKLDHPNIIKSIDYFADENEMTYVLLEYVEGKTVHATPRKAFTAEQGLNMAVDLLKAIEYGLELGYINVDLHKNNVMLSDTHQTKIVDISSFFTHDEIISYQSKKLGLNPFQAAKIEKFKKRHGRHFERLPKGPMRDEIIRIYLVSTFDDFIEMTLEILNRSKMDRETKLEIYSELKKVSWNFQEDKQEGIDQPVQFYLSQAEDILSSKLLGFPF